MKALETLVQWYDDGTLGPATMAGKPDVANGAFDGEYLLTFQGPWFFTGNKEEDIAKVQSGLLPAGEAGSLSVVGGENLCLFSSGTKQEAAWVFARFLMGEFAQKAQALGGGHLVPTVKEYANSEEVMAVENMAVYVEQLENAVSRTHHPNWEKMSEQLNKLFQSCMRHEDEPKACLLYTSAWAKDRGIEVNFGAENDFYLFRTDEEGEPTDLPFDNAGFLDEAPEDRGEDVRRDICLTLELSLIHIVIDFLVRRRGLTYEEAASVMAAPFWSTIDRMDGRERARMTYLRSAFGGMLVTGPFSITCLLYTSVWAPPWKATCSLPMYWSRPRSSGSAICRNM